MSLSFERKIRSSLTSTSHSCISLPISFASLRSSDSIPTLTLSERFFTYIAARYDEGENKRTPMVPAINMLLTNSFSAGKSKGGAFTLPLKYRSDTLKRNKKRIKVTKPLIEKETSFKI